MAEDKQLLAKFANEGAETAFAELVRRHLNLVYATALRQLNGDCHLAQDVTQTVFSDLARKSSQLTRNHSIAGWLYTSARFAAAKAVRTETRRRAREEAAVTMVDATITPPPTPDDLRPLLDDALSQLDEQDRDAVVLRFFEASEFSAVGEALGLSQNAARMRVERALDKLRALLEKRGLKTTGAVLGATLSEWASKAAPAGLADSVIRAATLSAATTTSTISPFHKLLVMGKSKLVVTAAALGVLTASVYIVEHTVKNDSDARPTPSKASSNLSAVNAPVPISALQATPADPHAFQKLQERHDARVQAERARSVQAAEAAWDKSKTELHDWVRDKAPGVTKFGASVHANLPFGQTLITGGWNSKPGRRTVAMVEANQIDAAGNLVPTGAAASQMVVSYKFLEAPSAMLDKMGLQSLNSQDNESESSLQMPSTQAEAFVKQLEGANGVDVLSMPRITTLNDRPASVASAENEMVEGREQELGVQSSFQPIQIAPDGMSMDLGITVRYALKTADTLTSLDPAQSDSASSSPDSTGPR